MSIGDNRCEKVHESGAQCLLDDGHDGKHRLPANIKHTCHWPNCTVEVPAKMWGCKSHWFTLPKGLRNKVWATYKPGQEITKTPSKAYIIVAGQVNDWCREYIAKGEAP